MAKSNVAKRGRAGERPVSREIKRAAKRAGIRAVEAPAEDLDRTDEELDVLRNLAKSVEDIFEREGEAHFRDPSSILREALRSAQDDIATICDAEAAGGGVESSCYRRAELRIDLAIALFAYRQEFGYIESENEAKVREQFDAAEAHAAGGAS